MKKQTVMWTALPNGFAPAGSDQGARLRLSVFISPRLMTNQGLPRPTLSQFPDWTDWPAVPRSFQVSFSGGPTVAATVVGGAPGSAEWKALFKPTTFVRPYTFPAMNDRIIRSFPAGHVMSFLRQQYVEFAKTSPFTYPAAEQLSSRKSFGLIGTYRDSLQDGDGTRLNPETVLEGILKQFYDRTKAVPPSPTRNPALDFYQAKLFHRPRNENPVVVEIPDLDFHQAVSALGDYPFILRRMGLVIDLEVPFTGAIPLAGTVRVIPSWAPSHSTATVNLTPATAYLCDGSVRFSAWPRPEGAEIADGMLKLNDTAGYSVIQVDVDGAALKAVDFANTLLRSQSPRRRSADTPSRQALPAMRSGGLTLVRTGRAARLVDALQAVTHRNAEAEAGGEVVLFAEDLTRGYRIDVWDDRSDAWHSLCKRNGRYLFTDSEISLIHDDEGVVSMGVTESADGSSNDLYLHESMVKWEGWSLAAPRAGKVVGTDDSAATVPNTAATAFGLEATFRAAPRSLPRLRFGATYRMRARAADLAGNSLPPDDTADASATTPATYGRFEPIASPNVLLRAPTTEGESVERLVIRSNYNTPSTAGAERHIAPPRAAQLMAELHGMFDTTGGLDKSAYDTIVAREGLFKPDGMHGEPQLALPYLPDPAGLGAALWGLPGATPANPIARIPFTADGDPWPDWLPFRVVMAEGTGAPHWDAADRVLRVQVPKAEMATVRLSSYLSEDTLKQMGIWQWLEEEGLSVAQRNALKLAALYGAHWMLTPFRPLLLVHAVQQPLMAPEYQALKADKVLGKTFATLTDQAPIHGKSTLKLDVLAGWQEPIDALTEPKWRMVTGRAHVAEVPVSYPDTTVALNHQHEFGDTKYRRVSYSAVATTRYKEYFQQRSTETHTLGAAPVPFGSGVLVENTETVTNADGTIAYGRDKDYTIDFAAGTISRVTTGAIADGQAVKVAYSFLPGPVARETAAPVEVDVLNSARPAAPKVLYAVPTFEWSREAIADGLVVNRSGGALRIYMERPWFSAGDGELLGAVLWTQPRSRLPIFVPAPTRPPEALAPFVTQWGMDPIWRSASTYAVPSTAHFPKAVATGSALSIAEVEGAQVLVAGHSVSYDEERKLWYCDMEIDTGESYYPFVRLALARYQPKSVAGAHLSRVVLADFAQLAPDRLATVIFDAAMPTTLAVTVCGPGYSASGAGRGASDMEVTLETRRPGVEGDLSWIPVSGTAIFPLTLTEAGAKSFTWSGGVTLPGARGEQPYRLVVKEYERFAADGAGALLSFVDLARIRVDRRLVYAAVLEV